MSYYHAEGIATVLHGDCLNELRTIPEAQVRRPDLPLLKGTP